MRLAVRSAQQAGQLDWARRRVRGRRRDASESEIEIHKIVAERKEVAQENANNPPRPIITDSIQVASRTRCWLLAVAMLISIQTLVLASQPAFASKESLSISASCLMPKFASRNNFSSDRYLTQRLRFNATSSEQELNHFIQATHNSVLLKFQVRKSSPPLPPASHQKVFRSICGWRNSIELNEHDEGKLKALWAYDETRGCLVAKFIYYSMTEMKTDLASRFATLSSPLFTQKISDEHSLETSKHFSSCKLNFKYYMTMKAHLKINLLTIGKPNQSRQAQDQLKLSGNQQQLLQNLRTNHLETIIVNNNNLPSINKYAIDSSSSEASLWQEKSIVMPYNLTNYLYYFIEISAMPAPITSSPKQSDDHLIGVALANITMDPKCFNLNAIDPPSEADPFGVAASDGDASKYIYVDDVIHPNSQNKPLLYRLASSFHDSKLELLLTSIAMLVLFVLLHLLFSYRKFKRAKQSNSSSTSSNQHSFHNKQHSNYLPKPPKGFLMKLFCCCLDDPLIIKGKHKIYSSEGSYKSSGYNLASNNKDERQMNQMMLMRTYLRPLPTNMFENVELNENPNYLNPQQLQINQQNFGLFQSQLIKEYHIDRSKLAFSQRLGEGAYGEVYQGILTVDDDEHDLHSREVAVKLLTDKRMDSKDFIKEAINMSLVRHRNIVELIGVCFEPDRPYYIVMELLKGGNLKNFLIKNRDKSSSSLLIDGCCSNSTNQTHLCQLNLNPTEPLPGQQPLRLCMGDLLVFALDIARACDYMQKRRFVHRDLAARNCLLTGSFKQFPTSGSLISSPTETSPRPGSRAAPSAMDVNANHKVDLDQVYLNGYENSNIVAKLADFGMVRDIYIQDYYRTEHKEVPVRWAPPEILDGVATTKSDVWSFGVFLWELFSMGQLPYQNMLDNKQVLEFIKKRRMVRQQQQQVRQSDSNSPQSNDQELLLTINSIDLDPAPTRSSPSDCNNNLLLADEPFEDGDISQPPLPLPDCNTPMPVYAIMCSCWATNPEKRPQFEEIANRLYWCLSRPDVLATSLPCFNEEPHGQRAAVFATYQNEEQQQPALLPQQANGFGHRPDSRQSGMTQTTQLNWCNS